MSLVWRYIVRNVLSIFPSELVVDGSRLPKGDYRVRDRLVHFNKWFTQMRWLVCLIALALPILTGRILSYLEEDAFWPLIIAAICLAVSNAIYVLFLRRGWFIRVLIEIQMFTDIVILTVMLHFSGGIENPLFFIYLFHIIIGSTLLERRKCYAIVAVASVLFSVLVFSEMTGVLRHYTLYIFPHMEKEGSVLHLARNPVYVISLAILQVAFMSLTAYLTTTIMERLRLEEKHVLAEQQRLERVVEATGAGLALLDMELHPVWLNDRIKTWLGLSGHADEALAARMEEWFGGKDGPAAETFRDGITRVMEREFVDDGGSKCFFQVTIAPLMDDTGHVYQVVELTQNITQRKIAEAEMMHSAKMAVLGTISAGIAHEVGNPLASISTRLDVLEEEHDEMFLKESLRLLKSQIARITRIVHSVSMFARPADEQWSTYQVNQVLTETIGILRLHHRAKNCHIYCELDEELPDTMGVKDQMTQVFLNLGLNALEAMPHGGTLTVKTYIRAEEIQIEFADTGVGINDETRLKIFEPFFTTKDNGLGLGLYIVHSLVDAHDGRIKVDSTPGVGTLFTVTLPIRTSAEPSRQNGNSYRTMTS